jgi:hypothetical protein
VANIARGGKQGQCFARRHMKLGDYALYDYAAAVSRASGVFFSNDRRDAKEFGSGVSPRTIFASRSRLEQAGWLKRIDKGPRQKFNPVTGQTLSIRYRVLSHGEWATAHCGKCRFAEQDQSKPETPAAESATGPAAESIAGLDAESENPAAGCEKPVADSVKPAAESAAKKSKERREEESKEKKEERDPLPATSDRITPRDMQTLFDVAFRNDWKKEQLYQVAYDRFHVQVRDLSVAQFPAMLELLRERPPAIPRRIFGPAGRTTEDHLERLRRNAKLAGLELGERKDEP